MFVKKLSGENSRLYEMTIPMPDGRTAYYKLSIDPLKEKLFNKACEDGLTIDLNNYGTILESYYIPKTIQPLKVEHVG